MTMVESVYINALLADAAYANLINEPINSDDNKNALNLRLTTPLADFLVANFELVTGAIINTDDTLDSGFDAVVWRGKPDTEYAGKTYVSMRGTEGLLSQDIITDIDLAFTGNARDQIVDMVNWWLKISTPVGQSATKGTECINV